MASEVVTCKAGWLWKRGEVRRGWKKRWFEIRDVHVYYYKKIGEVKPLGVIPLSPESTQVLKYNIDEESPQRDSLCFRIQTPKRIFSLQAQSEIEMFEWVNYLTKHQQDVFSPTSGPIKPNVDPRRRTISKLELIRGGESAPQPPESTKTTLTKTTTTKVPTPPQIPVQQQQQKLHEVDVENQIDRLQTKLEESLTQITSMAMQSRQDKETISQLQAQLEKLQNESEAKSRKIDKLRSDNENLQTKSYGSSSKIDVNLNSVQAELTKTKETLMAQLTHASFLNEQVNHLEKEKETLREKVSQYVDLLSELEPLKSENEELKLKLSKKSSDNVTTFNQIDFLKERYFIAFTGQMKIQQVMQGKVCPISGLQLYEEAKASNVPVEEFESWIKKKVELAVIGNP